MTLPAPSGLVALDVMLRERGAVVLDCVMSVIHQYAEAASDGVKLMHAVLTSAGATEVERVIEARSGKTPTCAQADGQPIGEDNASL